MNEADDHPEPTVDDGVAVDDTIVVVRPRWAPLTLVAFVGLVICSNIGTAVAVPWSQDHPAGLLALNSRVRHLVLALANDIDLVSYVIVPTLRISAAFVVCHMIGRAYGSTILVWFGKYLGVTNAQIDGVIAGFAKAEWAIVPFFVGSNIVAAITGIERLAPRRLVVYVLGGIFVRLALYWGLSLVFDTEMQRLADFLNSNQRVLFIGSIVLVVVATAINLRRGRNFSR